MLKSKETILRHTLTLFVLFFLGCITGWLYETVFYYFDQGHFVKRGQGLGPWLPIYGFGALGLSLVIMRRRISAVAAFVYGVVGCGIIEFAAGWFLFRFFDGMRLWNYNVEIWNFGNIGGFVCLRSVLVFGVLSMLFAQYIIPITIDRVERGSRKRLVSTWFPVAAVFLADILWGYLLKNL